METIVEHFKKGVNFGVQGQWFLKNENGEFIEANNGEVLNNIATSKGIALFKDKNGKNHKYILMAHCSCSEIKLPKRKEWIGCDGKLLSTELINAQRLEAEKVEDYAHAAKCRDEIKRRNGST